MLQWQVCVCVCVCVCVGDGVGEEMVVWLKWEGGLAISMVNNNRLLMVPAEY